MHASFSSFLPLFLPPHSFSPARRPHSRLLLDELRRERGASSERFPSSAEGDGEREAEGGGAAADDDDDAGCGRVWRQEA